MTGLTAANKPINPPIAIPAKKIEGDA